MAYLLLAGLATPLVLSVHSVVSWDFAMAQLPGWHSTIFAPYFVAGAIFSGVAMVLTLLIPMRWVMGLEDLITPWHLDNLAKVILLTSLVVSYSYVVESFMTWYSQDPIELMTFHMRYFGPWGWMFWVMVFVQLRDSARAFLAADSRQPGAAVHHHDLRQHRDVVRALRDHRRIAGRELRAFAVAFLASVDHRNGNHRRRLRVVHHVVFALRPIHADHFDDRVEGGHYLAQAGAAPGICQGSMSAEVELVGAFPYTDEERLIHCIGQLQAAGTQFRVFSPIPSEHINKAVYKRSSFVRWFVLLGGITGIITAFVMTIGTSLEWNLVTGGKPIASIPPYMIIAFELMVLFGGISALTSWVLLANLPTFEPLSGYRSRFSSDEFGLVVRCAETDAQRFESMLRDAGAQEITREAA